MNRLKTDVSGGYPLMLDDLRWLDDSYKNALRAIMNALGTKADEVAFVLYGGEKDGDKVTINNIEYQNYKGGYISLRGEICKFEAYKIPVTIPANLVWYTYSKKASDDKIPNSDNLHPDTAAYISSANRPNRSGISFDAYEVRKAQVGVAADFASQTNVISAPYNRDHVLVKMLDKIMDPESTLKTKFITDITNALFKGDSNEIAQNGHELSFILKRIFEEIKKYSVYTYAKNGKECRDIIYDNPIFKTFVEEISKFLTNGMPQIETTGSGATATTKTYYPNANADFEAFSRRIGSFLNDDFASLSSVRVPYGGIIMWTGNHSLFFNDSGAGIVGTVMEEFHLCNNELPSEDDDIKVPNMLTSFRTDNINYKSGAATSSWSNVKISDDLVWKLAYIIRIGKLAHRTDLRGLFSRLATQRVAIRTAVFDKYIPEEL